MGRPRINKLLMNSLTTTVVSCFTFVLFPDNLSAQAGSPADDYIVKADNFRKNMQPDSAILYYEKAAVEFHRAGNVEKFVYAYNQIGILQTRQDKYEEAKMHLDSALAVGRAWMDTNSLDIATTYISLGVVYSAEENYTQALIYHNRALSIRLGILGENSAEVATSYGNIGNVYLRSREFDKAIDAHRKAMKIRATVFGTTSPEIAESYVGLGNAYREKKEYDSSLVYFQKALNNKILQRGEGHKDLKKHYNNISGVYFLMGNKEQGDLYKRKADDIVTE